MPTSEGIVMMKLFSRYWRMWACFQAVVKLLSEGSLGILQKPCSVMSSIVRNEVSSVAKIGSSQVRVKRVRRMYLAICSTGKRGRSALAVWVCEESVSVAIAAVS